MPNAKRRARSRVKSVEPISVWQALNEPVVEVSEGAARGIFLALAVILLAVWIAPYWGAMPSVAGATLVSDELSVESVPIVPEWYYVTSAIPGDIAQAFSIAANEVLDISEPVLQISEFYEPGVNAVWGAWLELMQDPY